MSTPGGVQVPAAEQRALPASLLVDANHVVAVDQLASRLRGARVTSQNYVMRPQRNLVDSGGELA